MRHWITASLLLAASAFTLTACNGGEEGQNSTRSATSSQGSDFTPVIATVGDFEITQGYFDYRYEKLGPGEKARYSGENWKKRFLDYLVEETLLFQAAKRDNYDRIPDVERRLDFAARGVLVMAYHDKKFKEDIQPSDEEIQKFYDENQSQFEMLGRALGYHIQCASKEKIDAAYAKLEGGERFAKVALDYSEDQETYDNGGLLGWFNPDGYVPSIGFNKEFTEKAFSIPAGQYCEPFKLGDNWHIVQIGGKSETQIQPLAEVRDRVVGKLRPILGKEAYASHVQELKGSLGVERFGEFKQEEIRTADQLYRLAAESRNAHAKLDYYQSMVDNYPEDPRAPAAQFMVGFIHSEEFADVPLAAAAFRELIREHPDSEYVPQAEWMLKNLGRKEPELLSQGAPQDPTAAKNRIDGVRND